MTQSNTVFKINILSFPFGRPNLVSEQNKTFSFSKVNDLQSFI